MENTTNAAQPQPPLGLRWSNLNLAFSVALHSLLTACSKEEFTSHFPFLKTYQQDALYKLYTQMIVAVEENVQEEFGDICKETKVMDALDNLEKISLGQGTDNSDIRRRIHTAFKEEVVNSKTNELKHLNQILQKVKEQNHAFAMKLAALQEDVRICDSAVSINSALERLRVLNAKLV